MKVSELTGEALDLWVAKALGYELVSDVTQIGWAVVGDRAPVIFYSESGVLGVAGEKLSGQWSPSTSWAQGGPIIDREVQFLTRHSPTKWSAVANGSASGKGPTPLIAAMRAYLASKYGNEVPDDPS